MANFTPTLYILSVQQDDFCYSSDDENIRLDNNSNWQVLNGSTGLVNSNWVDNTHIEVVVTTTDNNFSCLKVVYPDGMRGGSLYYRKSGIRPLKSDQGTGFVITYEFDMKRTYAQLLLENPDTTNYNIYLLRNNWTYWDYFLNKEDPKIKDYLQNQEIEWVYKESPVVGGTPPFYDLETRYSTTSAPSGMEKAKVISWVSPCLYYVFAEDGKINLYPVLYEQDPLNSNASVPDVQEKTRIQWYEMPGRLRTEYVNNSVYFLNQYASTKSSASFIGLFMGPNLYQQTKYTNTTTDHYMTPNNGGLRVNGPMGLFYVTLKEDLWSGISYQIKMNKPLNDWQSTNPWNINLNYYTIEHLRYLEGGILNSKFDLPAVFSNAQRVGSTYVGQLTIDYTVFNGGSFYNIYKNYGKGFLANWCTPFSTKLPVPIDTYLQWSNDNLTQLQFNRTQKVITSTIAGIGLTLGALFSFVTGGLSLTAIGSAAGALGSIAGAGFGEGQFQTAKTQAIKKYDGNINSADGTDFMFYEKYVTKSNKSNFGPMSNPYQKPIYSELNKTPYYTQEMNAQQISDINRIIYDYGWYQPRRLNNFRIISPGTGKFYYYQFDKTDPQLSLYLDDWLRYKKDNIYPHSCQEIKEYLLNMMSRGIRVWG